MPKHYDIIVIGSGGGAKISTPSSNLGFKVALCEMGRLGGTCLNRGCIPSKMLIHAADVANTIDDAHRFEIIPHGGYDVKFEDLVVRVGNTIDEESFGINPNIEKNKNIDWYRAKVKFTGERKLTVGDDEITADRIFIVAGSKPAIPRIPGLEGTPYMTSTEALRQTKQPKRLGVIGGGYIACELAHFFGSLGTDIFMFVRSKFLAHEDEEVVAEFTKVFSKRPHFNILQPCVPSHVSYDDDAKEFTLQYTSAEGEVKELKVDQLLVATGVEPYTHELDVTAAGIEIDSRGFIKVDDHLRTTASNVWAYGDIIGKYLFRHTANYEGEYLLETVIRANESEGTYPIDYTGVPHAVFTTPQIAGVGETEQELKKRGASYVKGVNPYSSSAMGMALRSEYGFVKLLIERGTRKILGCHIIGEQSSVLIHEVIPLMRLGGKLDDLLYCIHIHPALSELVRNAARRARNALVEAGDDVSLKLKLK